jgi:hypothetical protein
MDDIGDASEATGSTASQHAPHPATRAPARYVLTELLIVTSGVLIALSVDSLREWNQHRTLVHEARTMIAQEMPTT